jgi:hypothetical protein
MDEEALDDGSTPLVEFDCLASDDLLEQPTKIRKLAIVSTSHDATLVTTTLILIELNLRARTDSPIDEPISPRSPL